jgi:hypothetical protein
MSHASGEVWSLQAELRGYFEYNGTCDYPQSRIHSTFEQMWTEWRKDNERTCVCGAPPETVICYTNYGAGFHWPQKACFACMALIPDDGREEEQRRSYLRGEDHPFRGTGYEIGSIDIQRTPAMIVTPR